MGVFERGEVEHTRLRGHEGRHVGIAPRRRVDGGKVGKSWHGSTLTHRYWDTRAGDLVLTYNYSSMLLLFFPVGRVVDAECILIPACDAPTRDCVITRYTHEGLEISH